MIDIPQDNPPAIEYRMEGNQAVSTAELAALTTRDASATGLAITKAYQRKGFLAVRVNIEGDDSKRVVYIKEASIKPMGQYARYFLTGADGKALPLTQAELDRAIARAEAEARANNESLMVHVGRVEEDGTSEVYLQGIPLESPTSGGALSVTSFGPRYSGSDAVTLSGYGLRGDGVTIDGSATVGLAGLRKESRGGRYVGVAAGISKAHPYGLFSARVSMSRFKVGGANLELDQTGAVDKLELEWSHRASPRLTPFANLSTQTSKIGLADWSDTVRSTAFKAGLRGQRVWDVQNGRMGFSGDASIEQGLTASRSFNSPSPLLGDLDPHYTVISANASLGHYHPLGYSLTFNVGGQKASAGTPSGSQFFAGGPDRGSAYHTGVYAGPSGYYGSVQYTSAILDKGLPKWLKISEDTFHNVQGTWGLDGAVVQPVSGPSLHTASTSLGVRFQWGKNGAGSLAYAVPLDGKSEHKPRLTFFYSARF